MVQDGIKGYRVIPFPEDEHSNQVVGVELVEFTQPGDDVEDFVSTFRISTLG